MAKGKKISKFFRIATEGDTTDGRVISAEMIREAAETYDPELYGARVWLEHYRGIFPDGPFRAYGDVIALEAREVDGGKVGLFAQISPTDDLIELNRRRQKIYSSIEIDQNFAKTGKAYLVGLGVTDNPASLGTEMLKFSAKNPEVSPLAARKHSPENIFTATQPVSIEIEVAEAETEGKSFSDRLAELKNKFFSSEKKTSTDLSELLDIVEQIAEYCEASSHEFDALRDRFSQVSQLSEKVDELAEKLSSLESNLEAAEQPTGSERMPALGGDLASEVLTDC